MGKLSWYICRLLFAAILAAINASLIAYGLASLLMPGGT